MSETLDVYRDWLRITEPQRPLNHYQLLKLPGFEDDPDKIRKHYRNLNSHVRQFAAGKHAKESQTLLNELAKAMLCLTDSRRKQDYDATLGRKTVAKDTGRKTLAESLVERKLATPEQIKKAENFSKAVGVELRDALIQQKVVPPDVLLPIHAEVLGLPFVDLEEMTLDPEILGKMPVNAARQHSCASILIDGETVLVASPNPVNPELEEQLRLRWGQPIRSVICTPAAINKLVEIHYTKEKAQAELLGQYAAPAGGAAGPGSPAGPKKPSQAWKYGLVGLCMGTAIPALGAQVYFPVINDVMGLYFVSIGIGVVAGGAAYVFGMLSDA